MTANLGPIGEILTANATVIIVVVAVALFIFVARFIK
jgi:hypothetical protein